MVEDLEKFVSWGNGVNSRRFSDGRKIVKLTFAGVDESIAQQKYQQMRKEYELFKDYLKDYCLESNFFLINREQKWQVAIKQDLIRGTPLRECLNGGKPAIRDFFNKNLRMYKETGVIPDLLPDIMPDPTGGIRLTGKFTYRSGPNVIVVDHSPVLVDSTLNKSLRNNLYGGLVRILIVWRINSFLR